MKLLFLLLNVICMTPQLFAQAEKPDYKIVADKFQSYYNQANYDSIFAIFSPEMQAALPIDKTKEFLTAINSQAGKITQKQFIKYENNTYASYKTTFEKTVLIINISVNQKAQINGLFVKPYIADTAAKVERNKTKLILPFKDAWNVIWGGDTKEQNYHVVSEAQKNAFDIIILGKDGKSYKTDGTTNEDYYAFGKELFAPCDGEVVTVIDGVKDNIVGKMNTFNVGGNIVILKTTNNEFLVFCHFKHQSIKVKEGQKIKQNQLLGLCGNTGNSSEPHLHFHIQNIEDLNAATGIKCYFEKLMVNGVLKTDYSPVKGDVINISL